MNHKEMKSFTLLISVLSLAIISCATTQTGEFDPIALNDPPDWIFHPPLEEDFLFGIGSGSDLVSARQNAIVNVGQQLQTSVESVFEDYTAANEDTSAIRAESFTRQFSSQGIVGAKFVDQYQDRYDEYWVLVRVPRDCVLDVTESVFLSYLLEIKQDDKETVNLVNQFVNQIEEIIVKEEGWTSFSRKSVPWTIRVSDNRMKVDGQVGDWSEIPVYYQGTIGDATQNGTDLDYIKCAMDSKRAYFLLFCGDGNWSSNAHFQIDFDFSDGTNSMPVHIRESDVHTNFQEEIRFWERGNASGDGFDWEYGYDPGVIRRINGQVFEFSIPLSRYGDIDRFNIISAEVWTYEPRGLTDRNDIFYSDTWLSETEYQRQKLINSVE